MKALHNARRFVLTHRQYIPALALFAGFVWDFFTLGRPDQVFDNVVILFYLLLAGGGIVGLNWLRERRPRTDPPLYLLILIQFAFGNLASALFVLYGKSGTLVGNWPFLLIFLALLLGSELLQGRYHRLRLHVALYYLMLFAYSVLLTSVLLRDIGVVPFLISGVVSIGAVAVFAVALYVVAPTRIDKNKQSLGAIVVAVSVLFNGFYFANLIPPVPLALKDIGIYHSVERAGEEFTVMYEKGRPYEFWKRSDRIVHYNRGEDLYCFSSVFAPARLSTPIYHDWEHFDELAGKWVSTTRVSFAIAGGREEGFRGFSTKSLLTPGKWRCNVETERGVLIGRRNFEVRASTDTPELITATG